MTCPYVHHSDDGTSYCRLSQDHSLVLSLLDQKEHLNRRIAELEARLARAERVARIYTGRETASLADEDSAVAEWLAEP